MMVDGNTLVQASSSPITNDKLALHLCARCTDGLVESVAGSFISAEQEEKTRRRSQRSVAEGVGLWLRGVVKGLWKWKGVC